MGLFLSRTCNDAGESELERNALNLLLYWGNKGSSGSHKNMALYIPGLVLLKLDWSEGTGLWVNVCKGKGMWTRPGKSRLHLLASDSHILVLEKHG